MQLVVVLTFMVKVVRGWTLLKQTNSMTITFTSSKILTIPGRKYLHSSTPQLYLLVPPIPLVAGKVVGFSLLGTSEIQNNYECYHSHDRLLIPMGFNLTLY